MKLSVAVITFFEFFLVMNFIYCNNNIYFTNRNLICYIWLYLSFSNFFFIFQSFIGTLKINIFFTKNGFYNFIIFSKKKTVFKNRQTNLTKNVFFKDICCIWRFIWFMQWITSNSFLTKNKSNWLLLLKTFELWNWCSIAKELRKVIAFRV